MWNITLYIVVTKGRSVYGYFPKNPAKKVEKTVDNEIKRCYDILDAERWAHNIITVYKNIQTGNYENIKKKS